MPNKKQIVHILLIAGILLGLLQVWLPAYYVNGDGPCHVANAKIMHDFWAGSNDAFFSRFYHFNNQPNPNWATHIILALLMFVVNGVIAEKLLLTIYLLFFIGTLYLLSRRLNKNPSYWLVVPLVFLFHTPLAKGFYNFSFSLAFFCLLIYNWIGYLEKQNYKTLLLFFIVLALTYYTHPVAFVFGSLTCFTLMLSYFISGHLSGGMRTLIRPILALILCNLPFVILFMRFAGNEGGLSAIHLDFIYERFAILLRFNYLINYTNSEATFTAATGIVLFISFLISLIYKFKTHPRIHKYDGILFAFFIGFIAFFIFPDWMFGGGLFTMRAGIILYMLMYFAITYINLPLPAFNIAPFVLYASFAALFFIRLPKMMEGAAAIDKHLSVAEYIKPFSVVLPLNFQMNGINKDGKVIANGNPIFCHVSQYLGVTKTLVILDNYEANTGYFPLKWHTHVNPYTHLSSEEGIEGAPPYALINEYKQKPGVAIDYIVMWNYDSSFLRNEHYRKLADEINVGYHEIYATAQRQTILLERNR